MQPTASVGHLLNATVKTKIETHPCYSKQAHQYARLHLPVAPACNIQCNYCNRKFDCSNESRPGVVSKLLDVPQAIKRFTSVKSKLANLSVVGIAGPGDALANPDATFQTLKEIKRISPETQLCISTNGLALEEHVDTLKNLGVEHLTITINCIDPEIGAQIYPWIFYHHKRLRGIQAAEVLISRQLAGLKAASKVGMLVKINTVLMPGINDEHIETLAKSLKANGALLHNIMPLIAEKEHGTFFGINEHPAPTDNDIQQAQSVSSVHMAQMTHCKQCRADAVGLLDDDQSKLFQQPDRYRIAIAHQGNNVIDTHFGHANRFLIYDIQAHQTLFVEERTTDKYCNGQQHCSDTAPSAIELLTDCNELFCIRIGRGPEKQFSQANVKVNTSHAFQPLEQVLEMTSERIAEEEIQLLGA